MAKKLTSKTATKPKAVKAKTAPVQTMGAPMTLEETLRQLKELGNPGVRAQNAKSGPMGGGAGDNQFGVPRGDVRKLANQINNGRTVPPTDGGCDQRYLNIFRRRRWAELI